MGIDAMKMEEVKNWIRNSVADRGKKNNDLFEVGRMILRQENENTFACIPCMT